MFENLVGQQRCGRHLDHHTGVQAAFAGETGELLRLGGGGDHRCHHPRCVTGRERRGSNGIELAGHQFGIATDDSETPHAQRRVGLLGRGDEFQWLIRSGIERADHHFVSGERLQNLRVDRGLFVDARLGIALQETQFGAEQPDALHRRLACGTGGGTVGHVRQDRHRVAVRGCAGTAPVRHRRRCDIGGGDSRSGIRTIRIQGDGSTVAVQQHHGAGGDIVEAGHRNHTRDAELAGDDRGMAGGSTQRGGQTDDAVRIQAGGVGRCEILGTQDRRLGRHRHTGFG